MTDQELITVIQSKATAIMREPRASETGDPNGRADRLEVAMKYLVVCAILSGEIPFEKLKELVP